MANNQGWLCIAIPPAEACVAPVGVYSAVTLEILGQSDSPPVRLSNGSYRLSFNGRDLVAQPPRRPLMWWPCIDDRD